MRLVRVPSALVAPGSGQELSPAMVGVVWEIAEAVAALKLREVPADGLWLSVPSGRLRGEGSRSDNVWLRECLRRLTRVELAGEHGGDPWGAVLVAEWRLVDGGATVRLLLPPAALAVLVAPATFAQLEADALHRLPPSAMRLYGLLADKRRLRVPSWSFQLDELRGLLGVAGRRSYQRFNNLRQFVLDPAVAAINDFGTVEVRMTPERVGRSVASVRFDWRWRDPGDAAGTVAENARHSRARRRRPGDGTALPLVPERAPLDAARLSAFERSQVLADRAVLIGGELLAPGSARFAELRDAVRAGGS